MATAGTLPKAWKRLRKHARQRSLYTCGARFIAVVAGRRSGKTEVCLRKLVRWLPVAPQQRVSDADWDDAHYFYGGPTFKQAKKVAWEKLKKLVPRSWNPKISESELMITVRFATHTADITVFGFDKPQRFEGSPWDGGVVDESSDIKNGTFSRSVRPALSDRKGFCYRIGVPKRFGVGAAEYRKFFERCKASSFNGGPGEGSAEPYRGGVAYTWEAETILPADEIKEAKEQLDPKDYNEQYAARWETAGGSIFYAFDSDANVRACSYDSRRPLIVGSDFNVDPMAWVLCHRTPDGKTLEVFDVLWLRDCNTKRALDVLWERYGSGHCSTFEFYGDATSSARKSAASQSDYSQILNDRRFRDRGAVVRYPRANPLQVNRFAACNALFLNALGERRCFVDPRCKPLVDDLGVRTFKEGTREPDDYGDVGHITDALGYVIHMLWPIRVKYEGPAPKVVTKEFA